MAENKDFGNPDANVVETLAVDGSGVNIDISIGGKAFRNSKMAVGSECEATGLDGRTAKVNKYYFVWSLETLTLTILSL